MLLLAIAGPAAGPDHFTANELWTLAIAAYAAIISTFVLGWDAYKWFRSGARVDVSATADMGMLGGPVLDPRTYILVEAVNVGDRPTTITHLCAMYFDSWWRAYVIKRKPAKAFVISTPSETQRIPYRFDVGDRWLGMGVQNDDIERMAKDGYLFFILYTASTGRGHRVRVKIDKSADTKRSGNDELKE